MAIADTLVPSIEASSSLTQENLTITPSEYTKTLSTIKQRLPADARDSLGAQYLKESASVVPGFQELLKRTINEFLREDAKKGIRVILSALE